MIEPKIIPLARPNISEKAIDKVVSVLRSGMLVQGKYVNLLEENISKFLDIPNVSAVSSGTSSLHLALLASGIKVEDEVIIPALSYVATANSVEVIGAKPVFVDVKKDFTLNPELIDQKITSKTKAIMPVHEFGLTTDMDPIIDIAKKYNLNIIEDAACALGSKYKNQYCGTIGNLGSFSLHPRKAITSGEGGLVVTSSVELDRKIKTLRNHGIEPGSNPLKFVDAGFNYRLTDFQAALVLEQLEILKDIIDERNKLALVYYDELKNEILRLPIIPDYAQTNWQTFHIVLSTEKQRNNLQKYLMKFSIQSNYGAQCIPAVDYYKFKYKLDSKKEFPNAYEAYTKGLAIPLYETLNIDQIKYISKVIIEFLRKYGK